MELLATRLLSEWRRSAFRGRFERKGGTLCNLVAFHLTWVRRWREMPPGHLAVMSTRRSRPHMPRWSRSAVLGACLVLGLLGDVWHAVHLLVVHHTACPYDGALVHDDDSSAAAPRVAPSPSLLTSQEASVRPHHDHHDCRAFSAVQPHALLLPTAPPPTGPTEAEVGPPLILSSREVRRQVLSYAPRLPPP